MARKSLEEALKRSAKQHGFEEGTERYKRYVNGSLQIYSDARLKEREKADAARKLRE